MLIAPVPEVIGEEVGADAEARHLLQLGLSGELSMGEGVAVMDPGIFIRSFYFVTSKTTLRVVFVSLFELETFDINLMAETISTDASPLAAGGG